MATVATQPAVDPTPSHNRVEPGSVNLPLADFSSLPTGKGKRTVDADAVVSEWISAFNAKIQQHDYPGLAALFLPRESYWRDHLGLSWDFHTLKGPDQITAFLQSQKKGCRLRSIAVDQSSAFRTPHVSGFDGAGKVQGVESFVTTETDVGTGLGVVRLVQMEDGKWRAFTLFTSMRELKDYPEGLGPRRPQGVEHGGKPDRKNWQERRLAEGNYEDGGEPAVLILGAGQGGLTAAARLKMLGVDALVVDREQRIGDNWRMRYHQLVLHDPVWYDHMPYLHFPTHWPIFTPKDKLADFFESYANILELNVWTRSTMTRSSWDDTARRWTVTLERAREDGTSSETRTLHPRHVILATGHSGEKNFPPHIPGLASFAGDRLCHSSEFTGAQPNGRGKKALVVGCCNSGHDIAQDFYEKGYDVTMIQRSSTCVISSRSITGIDLKGVYEEAGPPVDDADIFTFSFPSAVLKAIKVGVTAAMAHNDAATLAGLERAGFKLDRGPDGAGLFMKYFQRGGGYYIDVGASQLIVDGHIKIKSGHEIVEILPRAVRFADGAHLPADEIVFATGYRNMRTQARAIFGDALADRVADVWGFNDEGEIRTMWRKSGHPGFWFFGGNLALCRYFSRMLALQIKALEVGLCEYEDQ